MVQKKILFYKTLVEVDLFMGYTILFACVDFSKSKREKPSNVLLSLQFNSTSCDQSILFFYFSIEKERHLLLV